MHASLIVVLSHLSYYLNMMAANHNYDIALHERKIISFTMMYVNCAGEIIELGMIKVIKGK